MLSGTMPPKPSAQPLTLEPGHVFFDLVAIALMAPNWLRWRRDVMLAHTPAGVVALRTIGEKACYSDLTRVRGSLWFAAIGCTMPCVKNTDQPAGLRTRDDRRCDRTQTGP
jgi:hypothetical protein